MIVPNITAITKERNTDGMSNLKEASIFVSITSLFDSKAAAIFSVVGNKYGFSIFTSATYNITVLILQISIL